MSEEADEFWEWLYSRAEVEYVRDNLKTWLQAKLLEWSELKPCKCGTRLTKVVRKEVERVPYEIQKVCVKCGNILSTEDRRPEIKEAIRSGEEQTAKFRRVLAGVK